MSNDFVLRQVNVKRLSRDVLETAPYERVMVTREDRLSSCWYFTVVCIAVVALPPPFD